MSDELLKALSSMPAVQKKKHYVTVQGKKYAVPLQKKLEMMRHGEEKYVVRDHKDGPVFEIPKPQAKTRYTTLQTAERGYSFEQGDIHWPNAVVDGGATWLIEYE